MYTIRKNYTIIDGYCTCGNKMCQASGKHPIWPVSQETVEDITKLKYDYYNYAVGCGIKDKLLVIDIDYRHDGMKTLGKLQSLSDIIKNNETLISSSPGGLHIYFTWDSEIKNKFKKLDGIDILWNGRWCVIPPSIHRQGKYEWSNNSNIANLTLTVYEEIISTDKVKETKPKSVLEATQRLASTKSGDRNNQLNIAAYNLALQDMSYTTICEKLANTWRYLGISDKEAKSTIKSAINGAKRNKGKE